MLINTLESVGIVDGGEILHYIADKLGLNVLDVAA